MEEQAEKTETSSAVRLQFISKSSSPITIPSRSSEMIYTKDNSPPDTKKQNASFYQQLSIRIEQPVGSMSISPSSRDIVLAARKGLFIIDLENPYEPPRELHHLTKWEVADVQWNPHLAYDKWVASTSNQKGLIWNLTLPSSNAVELILHGHCRAISDINWHPFSPHEVATCSVDTYVHLWDLRKPETPIRSFCAWNAGATQVKYNRKNEYLLASAHDGNIMIWDVRKGSEFVTKITAHDTKIYGIDWSRNNDKNIITCSLDKLVKIWNIYEPDNCIGFIRTNSPVWRARHTPVGHGILTMPQRSETTLYLWNTEQTTSPVETFPGHKDVVKEFVWRTKFGSNPGIDDREFQLITWSKDQHLRLWPISDKQLKLIGHERGLPSEKLLQAENSTFTFRDPPSGSQLTSSVFTASTTTPKLRVFPGNYINTTARQRPSGASAGGSNIKGYMGAAAAIHRAERRTVSPLLWMQNVRMVKSSGEGHNDKGIPANMHEEMVEIARKFPNVKVDKLNAGNYTISLKGPWSDSGVAFIRINISFPQQYPDKAAPTFDIHKTGMISIMNRTHMSQILNRIAINHVSEKRPCIETCIRYLLGEQIQDGDGRDRYGREDSDEENFVNFNRRTSYDKTLTLLLGDKDDHNIPFPVICGARFSINGQLVCFFSNLRSPDVSHSITQVKSNSAVGSNRNIPTSSYTYTHPRSYDSWEQYKMIARLPRPVTRYVADDGVPFNEGDEDYIHSYYYKSKSELHDALDSSDHVTLFQSTKLDKKGHEILISDLSELMPVSQKLAKSYILNGNDPAEICKKNAQVAADNNRPDLEQAWLLASLILTQIIHNKRMSSERLLLPLGMQSKYVNKRRLSNNSYEDGFPSLFGRVNWGFHPLGRNIVQNLFNHFAALGDIQMFAMLACVFREPFPPQKKFVWSQELHSRIIPDSLNPTMSHNTGYFNTESYLIPNFVRNHYQYGYQTISSTFGQIFSESNSSKGSVGVINNQVDSNSNITISATPPTPSTLTYGNPDDSGGPIMIPSSSHSIHHQRRSTFGGTSKESNHFSSSVSTTASSPRMLRKGSPATSYRLENFGFNSMGYCGDRFMDVERKIEKKGSDVNLIMMNCGEFDDERNPQTVALLDDDRSTTALHDQYRLAYAEILYHWGLYEARTELLKFMSFVKTTVGSPLGEQQQPLEIGIHCHQCGAEIKAGSECGSCQRKRIGIKCSICHRFVKGLTNFCIMCKHGGHTAHLREWFESENVECPTGCGCRCMAENGGFKCSD